MEAHFVRWQGIAIAQLGYAVNLILALATATLGFVVSLLKDKEFIPSCWSKCFIVLSSLCLLVSMGLGVWCVINRLLDFRNTKDNARDRETMRTVHSEGREELQRKREKRQDETDKLRRRTWTLLWWQMRTFGIGVLALVIAVAIVYNAKLF
jgi:hypothetical protein